MVLGYRFAENVDLAGEEVRGAATGGQLVRMLRGYRGLIVSKLGRVLAACKTNLFALEFIFEEGVSVCRVCSGTASCICLGAGEWGSL